MKYGYNYYLPSSVCTELQIAGWPLAEYGAISWTFWTFLDCRLLLIELVSAPLSYSHETFGVERPRS